MIRIFTSVKTNGPIVFFLTLMGDDQVTPATGEHHLEDFYIEEVRKQNKDD